MTKKTTTYSKLLRMAKSYGVEKNELFVQAAEQYDTQMRVIQSIKDALDAAGIRVETDNRAEKIGYKIREARNERVPYIIVVGEKDQEANMVSLRSRKNGEEGQVALADFIARIKEEIDTKVLD